MAMYRFMFWKNVQKIDINMVTAYWCFFFFFYYQLANKFPNYIIMKWTEMYTPPKFYGKADDTFWLLFNCHLQKLCSLMRFWLEKLKCGFCHSIHSWKISCLATICTKSNWKITFLKVIRFSLYTETRQKNHFNKKLK